MRTTLTKLSLVFCVLIVLFAPFFANAKELQGTCACSGISGPTSTCPNVQQTISVTNAPTGSVVSFSTSNGNIVSQSGASAVINQPGSYTARVCFPLTINVPKGSNCGGTCTPVGATLSSNQAGNPSSLTICTTPPGPSTIVLTCNPTSGVSGALYRFVRNGVVVAQGSSNTLTVSISDFSSITLANYYCQVITQSGTCVGANSNSISIQRCSGGGTCTNPVRAVLSSNQAGNPSSLTICTTPPGPSTIILTCSPTSGVSGALYRFVRNGVVVAQGSSNSLTVSINDFSSITLANYYCQVITQSGTCVGSNSNVITIQRCAGGGPCTTPGQPSITVVTGTICPLQTSQLQCIPAGCSASDSSCLSQYKYQLFRSSGFSVPGPTASDYQFSNVFYVTALAGETFTCRVTLADSSCVGTSPSVFSSAVSTSTC